MAAFWMRQSSDGIARELQLWAVTETQALPQQSMAGSECRARATLQVRVEFMGVDGMRCPPDEGQLR